MEEGRPSNADDGIIPPPFALLFQQDLASQTAALAVRRLAGWRPERLGPNREPFHRGWRFDLLLRVPG